MIIPTGHEELRGRRWPVITIAIVALNVVAFFGTNWTLEAEAEKLHEVKLHILEISAAFPDVQMSEDVQKFVQAFARSNPRLYESMKRGQKPPESVWEIQMLDWEPRQAQTEMNSLAVEFQTLTSESLLNKYAYVPYQPSTISLVTANFLHAGWLHIIFNMWFLWLAGTVVEDAWGRLIYPVFYLVAGLVGLLAHATAFPDSIVPVIGASGAVAALMGSFLVLMPKTKIQFVLVYFLGFLPRFYRFKAATYVMLPLWALTQVFWAMLDRSEGGVAYWSHIGGFGFGVAVALVMKLTGIHKKVDQEIEDKVGWSAPAEVVQAGELMEKGQTEQAIETLHGFLAQNPGSIDGHETLLQAYWKTQDLSGQRETLVALCRLHLKGGDKDVAVKNYEEFTSMGGINFPIVTWQELCRHLEAQQHFDRAAMEYESLAKTYPKDRASVAAYVAAARLQMRKLNNRDAALRLYKAAETSPVPHLDWDTAIKAGLKECDAEPIPAGSR